MINTVIASDIKIYCEGLHQLIAQRDDLNVLAVIYNANDAIKVVAEVSPDLLLLDMTMPDSDRVVSQRHKASVKTKIAALTVSYEESHILDYAEAGVTCYVPREASVEELINAIRQAVKGEYYCPPKVVACVLNRLQNQEDDLLEPNLASSSNGDKIQEGNELEKLTLREQQIVSLLAKGMSNKRIAQKLNIEVSTVKNHVHNLLVKLDVKSRCQVIPLFQLSAGHSLVEPLA